METPATRTIPLPGDAELRVRDWEPAAPPWIHVLLVHGVAEHVGRYARTGRLLAAAGAAVTGYDHRGHGGSSGARGDVERWEDLLDDLARMLDLVRGRAGTTPVAILAHSMGGLVALDALLAAQAVPDLLVLSAPGLADGLPRWQHAVAPFLARVIPGVRLPNAWDGSALSRDPEVARDAAADPLTLRSASIRLGAGAFRAQDRVNAAIGRLDRAPVPTLVHHGEADPLVPPAASVPLGALAGVTRRTWPGLRHEVLNEPEGPEVVSATVGWLREAAASG